MSYPPPHHGGGRMGFGYRAPPPRQQQQANHYGAPPPTLSAPPALVTGPPVTVFVGNITERASDGMVRHLLTSCGPVVSWKRVQGATGRLQAFGFCEYAGPDPAARAIRLLHEKHVADKKLVVKVDAKAAQVLEDYKRTRLGVTDKEDKTPISDERFLDDAMRRQDGEAHERISAILEDHREEMAAYVPHEKRYPGKPYNKEDGSGGPPDRGGGPPTGPDRGGGGERGFHQTGPKESLDDVEMEDGKRDIINTEILKFRETMKKREAEKEEQEKKRREAEEAEQERMRKRREELSEKNKESSRSSREKSSRRRSPSQKRSRSRSPSSRRRDRDPSPRRGLGGGFGSRGGSRGGSSRPDIEVLEVRREDRSRSRGFGGERRSNVRSRSRSPRRRSRERDGGRGGSTTWRDREKEDEEREARKAEKKAREKEASYQERLRKWEARETKMAKEAEKEAAKEAKKAADLEREAKKLRSFLEDYDDDRDDPKYYKGREMERRQNEREREAKRDEEDRKAEKEEIEELKAQIRKEGFDDPDAELRRRQMIEEAQKNSLRLGFGGPAPHVVVPTDTITLDMMSNGGGASHDDIAVIEDDDDDDVRLADIAEEDPDDHHDNGADDDNIMTSSLAANAVRPEDAEAEMSSPAAPPSSMPDPTRQKSSSPSRITLQPIKTSQISRRKLDVKDVFNTDDDDGAPAAKKRRPPGQHDQKKKEGGATSGGASASSVEEKRKHIKSLIEKIPTDKTALFEYQVDWELVDGQLMERRIRPWVNKKITEYIGEPEPTLTEFICSKVLAGSSPKAVLEDVQMVLDEEAEVFVVKMWRLLIYEILNKKHKAMTAT